MHRDPVTKIKNLVSAVCTDSWKPRGRVKEARLQMVRQYGSLPHAEADSRINILNDLERISNGIKRLLYSSRERCAARANASVLNNPPAECFQLTTTFYSSGPKKSDNKR